MRKYKMIKGGKLTIIKKENLMMAELDEKTKSESL